VRKFLKSLIDIPWYHLFDGYPCWRCRHRSATWWQDGRKSNWHNITDIIHLISFTSNSHHSIVALKQAVTYTLTNYNIWKIKIKKHIKKTHFIGQFSSCRRRQYRGEARNWTNTRSRRLTFLNLYRHLTEPRRVWAKFLRAFHDAAHDLFPCERITTPIFALRPPGVQSDRASFIMWKCVVIGRLVHGSGFWPPYVSDP